MGKKREQRLREAFEELSANFRRQARSNAEARQEAQRKTDEGLGAALRSMTADSFLIVTKSGHVVKGRARDVQMNQETATFGMGSWVERVPCGRREYSANITIEPITNSEA